MIKDARLHSPKEVYDFYMKKYGYMKSKSLAYKFMLDRYYKPIPNEASKILLGFGDMMKGRYYTFQYNHPIYEDKLDYYDRRPIILVTNSEYWKPTKHHLITGININFLPTEMRILVMEKLFQSFNTGIQTDYNKNFNGKTGTMLNRRIPDLFSENFDYYHLIKYILQVVMKSGFEFAIRRYWWKKVYQPMLIDYQHWALLNLVDPKDMVGATLDEIYQEYWKFKLRKQK